MKIHSCKFMVLFFLIVSLAFSLSGCGTSGGMDDEEGGGGTTPVTVVEPAVIEMAPGKTTLPADGVSSTTITASMTGATGEPVSQGTAVTFTTTLGKFPNGQSSYTVKTPDETGSVSTSLIAGDTAGTAQIRAMAGNVSQATTLEFTGDSPSASVITLTATPDRIPADGVSYAKVKATVKDSSGTAVAAGTRLTFTTTYGTFLSGGQTATALTDDEGSASVSLISSTTDAKATVVCNSGNAAQIISVIFGEGATNLPVASISLKPEPDTINADGFSSGVVTAELTDGSGEAVPDGTQVTLTTTIGRFPNGKQTISLNTVDGTAAVALISVADQGGVAKITASAGGVSQSATVEFTGGTSVVPPPASIVLTATPNKIPSDGVSFSKILATLKDSTGENVSTGTTGCCSSHNGVAGCGSNGKVICADGWTESSCTCSPSISFINMTFTTTHGTFLEGGQSTTVKTDINGAASVSLISSNTDAVATVTCSSGNIAQVVTVIFGEGATNLPVASISLSPDPDSINPDGYSSTVLTAELKDGSGNAVPDGTQVKLTTTLGKFPNELQQIILTTSGGKAVVALISIEKQEGVAKVTASAGGVSQSTSVSIGVSETTAPPSAITVSVGSDTLIFNGLTSTNVVVNVMDSEGDPVADGAVVNLTIEGPGSFDDDESKPFISGTTANGTITGLTYYAKRTADSSTGVVTIKATTSNGITASATINLVEGKIFLRTNPSGELVADGKSTSKITAQLTDANGNELQHDGISVTFSTDAGSFAATSDALERSSTDASGAAFVNYVASTVPGEATVTVFATGSGYGKETVKFTLVYQQIASLELSEPVAIPADGVSSTTITATAKDSAGNPVSKGTKIIFRIDRTDLGKFSNGTGEFTVETPGATGAVTVSVISAGKTAGTATITGTAGSVTQGVTMDFTTEGADPQPSMTLKASPVEIVADGKTTSIISASLKDASGDPAPAGTTVNFSTTIGTFPNGNTYTTDDTGSVTATLLSAPVTATGPAIVNCSGLGLSKSINVLFTFTYVAGPPNQAKSSLTANPLKLVAGAESTSTIRAEIRDEKGNPVEGAKVVFKIVKAQTSSAGVVSWIPDSNGGSLNPTIADTTKDGIATSVYTPPASAGIYRVMASVVGTTGVTFDLPLGTDPNDSTKTVLTPLSIELRGAEIAAMTVTSNRSTVPINKTGTTNYAVIRATPTLEGGAAVPDGTLVTFSLEGVDTISNKGTLEKTQAETFNGVAEIKLYSGPDAGKVKVIAQTGSIIAESEAIEYTRGSIELSVTKNALLGSGAEQVEVRAVVKDESGNLVDGGTVNFSINDPTLGQVESPKTTASGIAKTMFTAVTKGGTAIITGVWVDNNVPLATGTVEIQVLSPPAFILVSASTTENPNPNPVSINVKGTGGQATSQIVFDVNDISGEPVADGYCIDFEILTGPNGGEELSPAYAVTSGGKVSTILRSGFKSGPVSIKATYRDNASVFTTTTQISIKSGPPVGEEFGISAQYYNISGLHIINLQDPIQADVGDFYGNAVPENTAISFKTYNTGGEIHPASAGTSGIYAISTLYSVASPIPSQGFLSVTAEAVNGGRTTHITSMAVVPQTANTQIIYAGTDGGGVYRSTDSGSTWQNISRSSTIQGQNWIDPYVNDVDVDPDNYDTVYAATGYLGKGNVYRSLDGGLTWNSNNIEEWNGIFSADVATLSVLCDDGSDHVWIGTYGAGLWYATDKEKPRFTQAPTLGHGKIVQDIVKAEGTGATAKLYAGTAIGVFRSTDGGTTWTEPGSGFLGDYITKLALYPKSSSGGNDVLYAGTEGAGIWVSLDSGVSWTRYSGGIGKGVSSGTAKADGKNTGTGNITETTVKDASGEFYKGTPSDTWTVTVTVTGSGDATVYSYAISGKDSGDKTAELLAEGEYYVIPNMLRFKPEGKFKSGDKFTFTTTRDPGENIKDILVDEKNHFIYALTYFYGEEEIHPVGNVYVHELNIDGSMPLGDWREANINLPQFDPPDDTTLFGVHSLAMDDPENPRALFIGGEGINFYKATSGLTTGNPAWQPSKNGLTNLVMARMPILFSDICSMDIEYPPTEIEGVVYINTTTQATVTAVVRVVYVVYIQDQNGNPPISGSTFTVTLNGASVRTVTYPDAYTYTGTFRDPSDASTDNPYIIQISLDRTKENKIVFSFKPTCDTATVPGCSGANEEVTDTYPEVKKPTGTGW